MGTRIVESQVLLYSNVELVVKGVLQQHWRYRRFPFLHFQTIRRIHRVVKLLSLLYAIRKGSNFSVSHGLLNLAIKQIVFERFPTRK